MLEPSNDARIAITSLSMPSSSKDSMLSCRILGFYPFPTPPPKGPFGWLLRDTHQAIIVSVSSTSPLTSSASGDRVVKRTAMLDFMTQGGTLHPVWYDEYVKWHVFLGGNISGEVRVKLLGNKKRQQNENTTNGSQYDDKMERLLLFARSYDCKMNLYGNNCRMFTARMEREVERLNSEDFNSSVILKSNIRLDGNSNTSPIHIEEGQQKYSKLQSSSSTLELIEMVADIRCVFRIVGAGLLPALYPLSVLLLLYGGVWIA